MCSMADSLERINLSTRLADIMEREIKGGGWGGSLPGHRSLMNRYAVSANTCLAAIALLEARGVIAAGEQGRRRRILARTAPLSVKVNDLLIIDRMGMPSGEDHVLLQAYREAWEKSGGTVQSVRMDFTRCRHPAALLRESVKNHRADAILLHVPPRRWTEAALTVCPVFLSGGEWEGLPITGVGFSTAAEIGRCIRRLQRLGHHRIAMPHDDAGGQMTQTIRGALAAALDLAPEGPEVAALTPVCRDREPGAWLRLWKALFNGVKPTAIVVWDDIHFLSLAGCCHALGLHIPRDVSVICLEQTGHLNWCHPRPCQMKFPVRDAVAYLMKWKRSGCRALGMKHVALEACEGETVIRLCQG